MKKCIVPNCTNQSDQGTFIGSFCAPCLNFLKSIEHTNCTVFRNIVHSNKEVFEIINEINELKKLVKSEENNSIDIKSIKEKATEIEWPYDCNLTHGQEYYK